MSLLWHDLGDKPQQQPSKRRRGTVPIVPADTRGYGCAQCSLDREPLHHPKMPATGAARPIVYVLGEAPGEDEDTEGEQFVGKAGRTIRDCWPEDWTAVTRWNNTLNCRPPDNRDPSELELACCRSRIEADILATKPKVIVAVGAFALQWLTQTRLPHKEYDGGRQRADEPPGVIKPGLPAITHWRGRRLPANVGGHVCWVYPIVHPSAINRWRNDKKIGDAWQRTFERDIERMFNDVAAGLPEPYVEPPEEYRKSIECLTTYGPQGLKRIADRLAEIAQRASSGIDVETNAVHVYHTRTPKLLTIAVGSYHDTFAFGIDHPECKWTPEERDVILAMLHHFVLNSGKKCAHYLKMEQEWMSWLLGDEVLYDTEWGDTHAQAHAIDERPVKELGELTTLHFGFDVKALTNMDKSRLAEYPLTDVLMYNGLDTKYTDGIYILQEEIIRALGEGVSLSYHNLARLSPSLVQMQSKGLVRNVEQINLLSGLLKTEEAKIKLKIIQHKDVEKFRHTRVKPVNPASNKDMLEFFNFLGFKLKSVGEEVLVDVDHPVARLELQRREEAKLESTYVRPLMDGGKHVRHDGRVHPNFNQSVTVTTRLSSDDPNAQNFPRRTRKEIRRVIGCPPGTKFVAMDFGQIEARVVAMLSKDPTLVAETNNGDDIHGVWTQKIGQRFVPERLKDKAGVKGVRDVIKNSWTFPLFFGSECGSAAQDLSNNLKAEVRERELMPFYEEFWAKYPVVLAWQDLIVARYWELGYVETATGFRRHEPMNRNEIINHPVQGTAAQIVVDAQYRIDLLAHRQQRPDRAPIMNVHDDLSFYLLIKSLEEDIEFLAREMCCCSYSWINVPLSVEVSLGDNWCDKTELHTFTTNDFQ